MGKSEIRGMRALSVQVRRWQSRAVPVLAGMAALALAAPALGVPGGDIGTLASGRYVCERPAPDAVLRGKVVEDAGFTIVTASSYRAQGTLGSYLLTGSEVAFTSGPRRGERYRRISPGSLRRLDAGGAETPLRCVLANSNNRQGQASRPNAPAPA